MKKSNLFIMYDCPFDKCDKLWLYDRMKEEAKEWYHTVAVPFPYKKAYSNILLFGKRGIVDKLCVWGGVLMQCLWTAVHSGKNDVLICWGFSQGLVMALLLSRKKGLKVVSLNWLSPPEKKRKIWLAINRALKLDGFYAVTNSVNARIKWLQKSNIRDPEKICVVFDVYNDRIPFRLHWTPNQIKYCFTGGVNNRDWKLLIQLAGKLPYINFKCIAQKNDWEKEVQGTVPENMEVFFDVPKKKYYEMLEGSYFVILPLKEERPSGLIHLLRAIQDGILVTASRYDFTEIYFEENNCEYLIKNNCLSDFEKIIDKVWRMDQDEYENTARRNQEYIKGNFSPEVIGKQIYKIIDRGLSRNESEPIERRNLKINS